MTEIVEQASSGRRLRSEALQWSAILLAWFVALCIIPDPRPLGAPQWAVKLASLVSGSSEATSRAIATVILRGFGLAVIGILVALSLSSIRLKWAIPITLLGAPVLGLVSQRLNYGYFPVYFQVQIACIATGLGALAGLAMRRSRLALLSLIVVGAGLFVWVSATGISGELDAAARASALHILEDAENIAAGDQGFEELLQLAFAYADDNSHASDPVLPNKAAILALGVILGEERVADVAGRSIDASRKPEMNALRKRVTLRERHDLARHFWVSAALAILADESRSMTVGIGKELMDATPGGSGFSFVDLTADRAGILFAELATRDASSAREVQIRIRSGVSSSDYCPEIADLPEGLSRDEFQLVYGGLGGEKTQEVVAEIQARLATCQGLQ